MMYQEVYRYQFCFAIYDVMKCSVSVLFVYLLSTHQGILPWIKSNISDKECFSVQEGPLWNTGKSLKDFKNVLP